jgi:hypothetical protein
MRDPLHDPVSVRFRRAVGTSHSSEPNTPQTASRFPSGEKANDVTIPERAGSWVIGPEQMPDKVRREKDAAANVLPSDAKAME